MRKFLVLFRILVGTIFIISGLIKANDPVGFSYKLEEYFTVFKSMDSVAHTQKEMRSLTSEEVDAIFAGTSSIVPVDFSGQQIDLTAEDARDAFMYVEEEISTYNMVERKSLWNSFCNLMFEYALWLSIFVCIIEILLGLAVIAGVFTRASGILLFGMILFFLALTFYSAYFNKVTDCGCFGDALPLTPWQSFYKDVILLILILPLTIFPAHWKGNVFDMNEKLVAAGSVLLGIILCTVVFDWQLPAIFIIMAVLLRWIVGMFNSSGKWLTPLAVLLPTLMSLGYSLHCNYYLPKKDYRPWAIGNSIPEKLKGTPEYADIYMIYKNKESGALVENLAIKTDLNGNVINTWEWMDSTFSATHEFVDQRKVIIKEGEIAPIHDMTLRNPVDDNDYFESFVYNPGYKLMVVTYDLSKTNTEAIPELNALAEQWMAEGHEIIGATASGDDKLIPYLADFKIPYPYYTNDATALKTIIRSNPGIVLLQDTIIKGKWPSTDLPSMEELKKKMK